MRITKMTLNDVTYDIGGSSILTVDSSTTLETISSFITEGSVILINNVTVDGVTYNGIASVSSDGTNITVICGDLYVKGTSDQTLANATTRWKFSEMIDKTVLTALYS